MTYKKYVPLLWIHNYISANHWENVANSLFSYNNSNMSNYKRSMAWQRTPTLFKQFLSSQRPVLVQAKNKMVFFSSVCRNEMCNFFALSKSTDQTTVLSNDSRWTNLPEYSFSPVCTVENPVLKPVILCQTILSADDPFTFGQLSSVLGLSSFSWFPTVELGLKLPIWG